MEAFTVFQLRGIKILINNIHVNSQNQYRQVNICAKLELFIIPLDITQVKFVVLNSSILPQTNISLKYNIPAFHPQPRSPRFQRPKWGSGSPIRQVREDIENSNP